MECELLRHVVQSISSSFQIGTNCRDMVSNIVFLLKPGSSLACNDVLLALPDASICQAQTNGVYVLLRRQNESRTLVRRGREKDR